MEYVLLINPRQILSAKPIALTLNLTFVDFVLNAGKSKIFASFTDGNVNAVILSL